MRGGGQNYQYAPPFNPYDLEHRQVAENHYNKEMDMMNKDYQEFLNFKKSRDMHNQY